MIVNAIIQARMGSKRLPGKVMMPLRGKPAIGLMVDRVRCADVDKVIVAGPACDANSPLARYLADCKIDHYFGDEENDLCARFLSTLALFPCDAFLRLCADSPFISPEVVTIMANQLRQGAEVASNVGLKMLTPGNSVEGSTVDNYRNAVVPEARPEEREHAGFPAIYRIIAEGGTLMDTMEDYERIKNL